MTLKACSGVVPDCHGVTQNGSGSSSVTSPALVLVETTNESVCGGTVFSTKMNGASGTEWSVKYNQQEICALKGSPVSMSGSYTHPENLTVRVTFWVIDPVQGKQSTDLSMHSDYSGRVETLTDEQKHFSLRLREVMKKDEHPYGFTIITNEVMQEYIGTPGVRLRVTDLQVEAPGEVTEGGTAVLTCKTTCSLTDPTFIWYKNGRPLTTKTNNQLHLQPVSSEDAGGYSCAVGGYQHLRSTDQNLRVRYPPKNVAASISPSNEIVEGSSVTLTCSSDGNPPVKIYTWFKGSTSVGKGDTYTIPNIRSEHSGGYTCQSRNEHGEGRSTTVWINVLYPPKKVSVSISGKAVEGSSVTLTCSSDGNPPVRIYTWFKGSTSVANGDTYNIPNIRSEHSGEYTCQGRNEHGERRSTAVQINVQYPPKNVSVSTSPPGQTVQSSLVTLTCSSDANPPVESYTWFIESRSSPVGSGHSYSPLQSGSYYCKAQNEHGAKTSPPIVVKGPPQDHHRAGGHSVILYVALGVGLCVVVVLLSVVFYRRNRNTRNTNEEYYVNASALHPHHNPFNADDYENTKKADLPVPPHFEDSTSTGDYENTRQETGLSVLPHDDDSSSAYNYVNATKEVWKCGGVGKEDKDKNPTWPDMSKHPDYSGRVEYLGDKQKLCSLKLNNVATNDQHMYTLRIKTNDEKQKYLGRPGVTLTVTELHVEAPGEVTEGGTAVLTCRTTCSLTDPTFIWYRNGRPLTTKTIKYNQLHLQPVSSEDADSYSCAVGGYQHLRSTDQTLRVRYPPKNVSVSISPPGDIVENSSVTLTCSSDANPPVKVYTWFKGSTSVGNGKTYNFPNIRSEDSGGYTCQSRNDHGERRSTAVRINVLYPPKRVSVSVSPSGDIVEGSSVNLTCSSDGNPPVKIYTWFKGSTPVGNGDTYNIPNIRSEHSGEYTCQSRNKHGERNSTVQISVQYPPKKVSVSISGEAVEGSSVNLTCSSDGNPPVKNYTWFKEGGASPVGSGHSYSIINITAEHTGLYYCVAQNEHGAQRSVQVLVSFQDYLWIIYAAIAVAAVCGIAVIVAVLLWRRKKRPNENMDLQIYAVSSSYQDLH
ncbi:hypothetical protein NFI96_006870 [Prochilodus magdalenae]|nr:hypothetical protein NFI96_006870 [Prochilodus magdalenae]